MAVLYHHSQDAFSFIVILFQKCRYSRQIMQILLDNVIIYETKMGDLCHYMEIVTKQLKLIESKTVHQICPVLGQSGGLSFPT